MTISGSSTSVGRMLGIAEAIQRQLSTRGEVVAVSAGDRDVSYRELSSWVQAYANQLAERGLRDGDIVAIEIPRSIELIVAVLATVCSGGAFLVIDPELPPRRRDAMRCLAQLRVTSRAQRTDGSLSFDAAPAGLVIDRAELATQGRRAVEPSQRPVYVVCTSGTSGGPKAVVNTDAGLLNRLNWMQSVYHLSPEDRVLFKTPTSFDVSVWEMIWPFMYGAGLVIAAPGGHMDPQYLTRLIDDASVTLTHFVPSMLALFLDALGPDSGRSVRQIICSGEVLPAGLVERCFSKLRAGIDNLYGPAEAAIDVTYYPCSRAKPTLHSVPIGRPITGIEILLLDEAMQRVPDGEVGELYIAGVGLALGYANDSAQTADKFVPHPFGGPGERMYRSGDLARRTPTGDLLFLGRRDHQVKIGGQRVELEEVRGVLLEDHDVMDAAVLLVPGADGHALAAFVATNQRGAGDESGPLLARLRDRLQNSLPRYMVPARLLCLPQLPVTGNGKRDDQTLRQLLADATATPIIPDPEALTVVQATVAELFREALRIPRVGLDDDFFGLGGSSISLIRVVMAIRKRFEREIPVQALLTRPSVRGMADVIEKLLHEKPEPGERDESESLLRDADFSPILNAGLGMAGSALPSMPLVTGANGFIGAHLIRELLRHHGRVRCLVRAPSDAVARERLLAALARYDCLGEDTASRVDVIAGDLAKPRLALDDRFEALAAGVDSIYHAGAWVNFVQPYEALRAINVEGTKELLRLAVLAGGAPFHFVSSNSVFGTIGFEKGVRTIHEDDDIDASLGHQHMGYIKAKWAAEKAVWNASNMGLPVTVHRCGLVMGHSQTGVCNLNDFASRLIAGTLRLGSYYTLRNKYDNFIPVDHAARAIVDISRQAQAAGRAFHIVNPQHIAYEAFWQLLESHGHPASPLDFDKWEQRCVPQILKDDEHPLFPLIPLFSERFGPQRMTVVELFQDYPEYDTGNVRRVLGDAWDVPRIDRQLVGTWLQFYYRNGFIKPRSA